MKFNLNYLLMLAVMLVLTSNVSTVMAGHHKSDEKKSEETKDSHCGDFVDIFNGKDLTGWHGDPKFWRIEDGTITGQTTKENPTKGNTFIIYVDENKKPIDVADFELTFDYKIMGGNSGVQYRGFFKKSNPDGFRVGGYQADIDAANNWAGTNYGEEFRGILAKRGESVVIKGGKATKNKKGRVKYTLDTEVTSIGDSKELAKNIKQGDWNSYRVVAKGNLLTQYINDVKMSVVIDEHKDMARSKGMLAFQLHQGPPMKIQFKNIKLKTIK